MILPVAGAVLGYLNARLGLSNDLPTLRAYLQTIRTQKAIYRKDELNLFYELEELAVGRPGSSRGVPETAERTFLIYQDREWTFKETYETVLKYGTWLKTKFGVAPGEVVALDFMNCDTFVFIWFGLWAIGAKPAFINYNLTSAPLIHCVRASTARVLLVGSELQSAFPTAVVDALASPMNKEDDADISSTSVKTTFFTRELEDEIMGSDGLREPNEARAGQMGQDMAVLIFTSGTTGLPKPAIVSWTKICVASLFFAKYLPLKASDRLYTVSFPFVFAKY